VYRSEINEEAKALRLWVRRKSGERKLVCCGCGRSVSEIAEAEKADPTDLLDLTGRRNAAAEHAVDRLRAKFGRAAVVRGLALDSDGDQ